MLSYESPQYRTTESIPAETFQVCKECAVLYWWSKENVLTVRPFLAAGKGWSWYWLQITQLTASIKRTSTLLIHAKTERREQRSITSLKNVYIRRENKVKQTKRLKSKLFSVLTFLNISICWDFLWDKPVKNNVIYAMLVRVN